MFAGGVYSSCIFNTIVVVVACVSYLFVVSPDVVGIGSDYFFVYLSCIYICSADYVGLPVLLYLLQCLVYHMLSKMRKSSGIYI